MKSGSSVLSTRPLSGTSSQEVLDFIYEEKDAPPAPVETKKKVPDFMSVIYADMSSNLAKDEDGKSG